MNNQFVLPTTLVVAGLFVAGAAGHDGSSADVVTILRDFGFPVFVSTWLLWRLEKRHEAYTARIEKLSEAIAALVQAIDDLRPGSSRPRNPGE